MRKLFILTLLAMIAIGGCSSGGTSADPLGTDNMMFGHKNDAAGTDWSTAMDVTTRGTVILTAKVKNATGAAVVGREVSFVFVSNTSGATLSSSTSNTDAAGEAMTLYTAGMAAGFDVVRASLSNGYRLDVNITVGISGAGVRQISLEGVPASAAPGQNSILTATVTDGDGNPVVGANVNFSFILNRSGAPPIAVLNLGLTDGGGHAVAIYMAGALTPNDELQDAIQAGVAGATAAAIVITRTAAGGGGDTGVRMTVTATPTSLVAGAISVIVAQVSNADGTAAAGLAVTFGFAANNSGAPALTVINATTDASGTAVATYTAGSNSPGLSIQDAVSASVTGSAGAAIITRLPAAGTGNRISLTLNPNIFPLLTTTSNCIVTATVLRDDGITPVANEPVTFSIVTGGGTIAPLTAPTNNSGMANAVFTAPGGATGFEAVVRAQIPGTTNGGDAVGIISW